MSAPPLPSSSLSSVDADRVLAVLDRTLAQLERTRRTLADVVASMGVPVIPGPAAALHPAASVAPGGTTADRVSATPGGPVRPALAGRRTADGARPLGATPPEPDPAREPSGMAALAPAALAGHVVDLRVAVAAARSRAGAPLPATPEA